MLIYAKYRKAPEGTPKDAYLGATRGVITAGVVGILGVYCYQASCVQSLSNLFSKSKNLPPQPQPPPVSATRHRQIRTQTNKQATRMTRRRQMT